MEGYRYFDANIRALPKKPDGTIDDSKPGFSDNDVDAFRHAYESGVFAQEYGEQVARFFGVLQEFFPYSGPSGANMDLWNNDVGIKLAAKHKTRLELLAAVKLALENGDLIISTSDTRKYLGEKVEIPSGESSVVKLAEEEGGRNSHFFDFDRQKGLTRELFVAAIKNGEYSAYHVRRIDGVECPVSNPDDDDSNNLG